MHIRQTSTPLVTGLISTSICFSFGFFSNVFTYNGLEFFAAYIAFSILLCYPTNIVAVFLEKTKPEVKSHSAIIRGVSNTRKLLPFSILLTGTLILLLSLVLFNTTTYVLDFFDNIPAIDRLSDTSLQFSSNLPILIVLLVVFIVLISTLVLDIKQKINLNLTLKTIAHTALYLSIILMFISIYSSSAIKGIEDFFLNSSFQRIEQIHMMLAHACIYAILSHFISFAIYKNIINVNEEKITDIRKVALKSILYNILFSFIVCITIYSILGDYRHLISGSVDLEAINIFSLIKLNSPTHYLVLEVLYITFNLIVLMCSIKYISELGTKTIFKIIILTIPFILTVVLISKNISYLDFSSIRELHILIIFVFLFDIYVLGWVYDAQKLSYEIVKMTNTTLTPAFNIGLRIGIPFLLFFVIAGYLLVGMSPILQAIYAFIMLIMYVIIGLYFSKTFNQRRL